jgi:hypothetical protein
VRHENGDSIVTVEPARSREIGVFSFAGGEVAGEFVDILAEGSKGLVIADAVLFTRIDA